MNSEKETPQPDNTSSESSEKNTPEAEKNFISKGIDDAKDSISKSYESTKGSISKEISETKESISKTVDSGIKKTKWFLRKVVIYSFVAAIIALAGYMLWANWTYSEGTRTGYMMKISKKGYIFKTYEGQLNLGGLQEDNSSVLGNIWSFSLDENYLSKKLEEMEGKKVQLRYREINKAMPWQGETNYYVYDVIEK
ncbi:MAG: hypothetical protein AAF573_06340 [Bacteroidota bacterium]